MTDIELGYRIAKIGLGVFESGYDVFEKFVASHDRAEVVSELAKKGVEGKKVGPVIGHAKAIFQAGRGRDALNFIQDRKAGR